MILAIDLGSTSFKAAVVDENLRTHGFHACEVSHRFAAGGVVELPVGETTSALHTAIREALATAGIRATKLQAAAITSQAQTFTIVDRQGRPRMPFISWQDNRAADVCEKLRKRLDLQTFGHHCSYGSLLPLLQICKLRHLRETRPDLLADDGVAVCLPAYVVRQWCGKAVIDENLAAMSGLYSLISRTWWPTALRLCGLNPRQLPEICSIGSIAARTSETANSFHLPKGIPLILAGNDQTAGAFAAQLDKKRTLLVTLGTAQTAYICTDSMPRAHSGLFRGPFPRNKFYRMAADSCGGSIINWAKTILSGCESDKQFFERAARSPRGCHGLVFEPHCGNRYGTWKNIGPHHAPADFARSVIESLARRMSTLIRRLGVSLDKMPVLVAGGGSENPLWIQILSESLGLKLRRAEGRPYVGAARMAWLTLSKTRN